ncbi:MAG: shikimate dehydrogenase [Bifidobacteriaceae bacterium]|jgi:shikimate dehydrogenase|nr:shikimate dehydrogenase [Bifidobacteriaceae bacterium]
MTNRAAVLGSPISHSLSPALHRAAYRALGLDDWTYETVELDQSGLAAWLAALGPEWKGLSLTMPLKRTALGLVDHVQPLARMVGAANTVLFNPAGSVGANTDVHGIVAAIGETVGAPARARSASLLGGGATAASALAALAELGVRDPRVYVRSLARTAPLVAAAGRLRVEPRLRKLDLDRPPLDWAADLTVATLPPHAGDQLADCLDGRQVAAGAVLLDVTYDPWPSRLAQAWDAAGGVVVSGKAMLLHQAAAQFKMMTGYEAPLAAMRAAIA